MIRVSKSELKLLRDRFPDLEMHITVRKVYVVERPSVMNHLRRLR